MDDGNPCHHDPDPLGADNAGEQAHGRGRTGNPIEAIYDTKYRQTVDRHIERERQIQQREAAKPIVSAQQKPVVPPVAEPTRERAAEQGEDAGGGEQPSPGDLAQAMIDASSYQVGANQAVCRGPAYEIATRMSQKSRDRAPIASARNATMTGLPLGDASSLDAPKSP